MFRKKYSETNPFEVLGVSSSNRRGLNCEVVSKRFMAIFFPSLFIFVSVASSKPAVVCRPTNSTEIKRICINMHLPVCVVTTAVLTQI